MNPTVEQFRADFPEFSDPSAYPDTLITQWLTVASQMVSASRWGALLTTGVELFTAHYVVIAVRDQAAASASRIPGQVPGLLTSKSVGDVSASYDFNALLSPDAGFWNQTTYGQRFYKFSFLMGAGGLQLIC